jgi:protein subunit release factor B
MDLGRNMMKNCYVIIQPGAGGDNTKDQADNLMTSVIKICSKKNLNIELEDEGTLFVRGGL